VTDIRARVLILSLLASFCLAGCAQPDDPEHVADDDDAVDGDDDGAGDDDSAAADDDDSAGDDDDSAGDDDDSAAFEGFSGDWTLYFMETGRYWPFLNPGEFLDATIVDTSPSLEIVMEADEDPVALSGALEPDSSFDLTGSTILDSMTYDVTMAGSFRGPHTAVASGLFETQEDSQAWVSYTVYGVRVGAPSTGVAYDGSWSVQITETMDYCDFSLDVLDETWELTTVENQAFSIVVADSSDMPNLVGVLAEDEVSFDLGGQVHVNGVAVDELIVEGVFDSPTQFTATGTYCLFMCQVVVDLVGTRP
jgi:hypothetical protein